MEAASQDISICEAAAVRFAGPDYRLMCGPMVLVFLTAGKPVYIGWSKAGLGFCTGQRKYPVRNCEEVHVHPCPTYEDARELHARLVELHRPKHNATALRFNERAVKRLAEHYGG